MNALIDESTNIFRCPITHEIFLNPVIASDGIFYEELVLKKWLEMSSKSPICGINIEKKYYKSVLFNNLLKEYLERCPFMLNEQYKIEFDESIFYNYLNDGKISELIKYISVYDLFSIEYKEILQNTFKNNEITKILIDKSVVIINNLGRKLIHYVCMWSTPEMIKYIIDKEVDLECSDIEKSRPIHYICTWSTPEMIKYIIDKGVDLECSDINKMRPVHLICICCLHLR